MGPGRLPDATLGKEECHFHYFSPRKAAGPTMGLIMSPPTILLQRLEKSFVGLCSLMQEIWSGKEGWSFRAGLSHSRTPSPTSESCIAIWQYYPQQLHHQYYCFSWSSHIATFQGPLVLLCLQPENIGVKCQMQSRQTIGWCNLLQAPNTALWSRCT